VCNARCGSGTTCQNGSCQCFNGQRCNDACYETQSDPNNCGSCGNVCAADAGTPVCNGGVCSTNCGTDDAGDPLTDCNNACVNLQTNPGNCGACGTECPNGASCANGVCGCATGDILCGATCTNPSGDNANCGRCGNACGRGTSCTGGVCVAGCGDAGLTSCPAPAGRGGMMAAGDVCVDTLTNAMNCGACGTACPAGAGCVDGTCGCPAGETQCAGGRGGIGNCVDLGADNANCGSCGNACPGAMPLCSGGACVLSCVAPTTQCAGGGGLAGRGGGAGGGGTCADLSSDKTNCGFCGATCTGNLQCQDGACACLAPFVNCSGNCANLVTDNANCGSCGTVCVSPATCTNGACN
jgi:hypothetical protein